MVNTTDTNTTGAISGLKRILVIALIISLCVAAGVAIAAIVGLNEFDDTSGRIVGAAIALVLYSLMGLAATRLGRLRPDLGRLPTIELVLLVCGLLTVLAGIWQDDDSFVRAAGVALMISLGAAHASLLLAAR